jgi:hypothetical protein
MPGDPRPEPTPDDNPGPSGDDDTPMTPHATPLRDAQGRLTYIGEDGRRYVVAPPAADGPPEQDD